MKTSEDRLEALRETYKQLPVTRCRRRTLCCSMLPEMTLLEALSAIRQLMGMDPAVRRRLFQRLVGYFFLNPIEITSCPFLKGQDCRIYGDRFLGCRTYGLWSKEYYGQLAASSSRAKKNLQKQWQRLGVSLPRTVVDFRVPYCADVEVDGSGFINDEMLFHISDAIETVSAGLGRPHRSFRDGYFSDLSFLSAALMFGYTESVQMKFDLVREAVVKGRRERLNKIVNELPDPTIIT